MVGNVGLTRIAGLAGPRRDLLDAVLDAAEWLIVLLDLDGAIVRFNRACEELTGLRAADVLGGRLWDLVLPSHDSARLEAEFARLIAGGEPAAFENPWRTRDGCERLIAWSPALLRDDDGVIRYVVGTGLDITDRRAAEARLRRVRRDLAARTREVEEGAGFLRDLVASASHELRSPLTAIQGYLELVLDPSADPLSPVQREHLEFIAGSSRRLLATIDELQRVDQIDRDQLGVTLAHTDVGAILSTLMGRYAEAFVVRGVTLEIAVAPTLPAVVADPVRLEDALAHLLDNAAAFTPAGGAVRMSAGPVGAPVAGGVEIAVSDTGVGIDPAEQQRVFDRFYRGDYARRMALPGTGLGLFIARALIEAQGGELTVASSANAGATFTVSLPTPKEKPCPASSSSTTIPSF